MKTTMNFFKTGLMIIALVTTSCSKDGEVGPIGPAGPQGEQGIQGAAGQDGEALGVPGPQGDQGPAGSDGTDGADGSNGTDGTDGSDGTDGADGNANIQNYVFDVSAHAGPTINRTVSAITQNALDNDLIIGYLKRSGGSYSPIPGPNFLIQTGTEHDVAVDLSVGKYIVLFFDTGTDNLISISAGQLDKLRVIVAKSTNTTTGKSGKSSLLDQLKSAGIDLNNYKATMDYFGLEH